MTWVLLRAALAAPLGSLDRLGRQLAFHGRTLAWLPRAVTRYRREVLRLLTEASFGTGALAVIGGTVMIVTFMTFFTGLEVGIQGYRALDSLGAAAYTGFVAAYFNTREGAPLVAAVALSATIGCGFTAQLGSMRISEEIDALEVSAVPSTAYLVSTRLVAGFLAVIPLYVLGLLSSFAATRMMATDVFGQSKGVYDHYFHLFLPPGDVLWSFGKALVFATIVILVHCYRGFHASGGPAGVGVAVGSAVRTVITAVVLVDLLIDLAVWGSNVTVVIAG